MDVAITVPVILSSIRSTGWKDARVELVTDGAADATLTVFYTKLRQSIEFLEWDALR